MRVDCYFCEGDGCDHCQGTGLCDCGDCGERYAEAHPEDLVSRIIKAAEQLPALADPAQRGLLAFDWRAAYQAGASPEATADDALAANAGLLIGAGSRDSQAQ
jgi:hypothetical protein